MHLTTKDAILYIYISLIVPVVKLFQSVASCLLFVNCYNNASIMAIVIKECILQQMLKNIFSRYLS